MPKTWLVHFRFPTGRSFPRNVSSNLDRVVFQGNTAAPGAQGQAKVPHHGA
jgi:hypothetical protein